MLPIEPNLSPWVLLTPHNLHAELLRDQFGQVFKDDTGRLELHHLGHAANTYLIIQLEYASTVIEFPPPSLKKPILGLKRSIIWIAPEQGECYGMSMKGLNQNGRWLAGMAVFATLALGGCASQTDSPYGYGSFHETPLGGLVSGRSGVQDYLRGVEESNLQTRASQTRDVNQDSARAWNTETGRFEFVPPDTAQRWNEEQQRWEFTPLRQAGKQ